ncbi:sensor histidine kinase [Photobacterium sp. WH24]|uniref:sensor histidine kinase n=1 Tax=Photobacterium sp. WH24 TaxID=2827237 RepID=UPI001C448902|nr:sensor histidine kinase [Photobacterium sp. WH24]
MINFHSLSQRLYLAITSALIIFTGLIFFISTWVLKDKTERLYDNMMIAVSKNLDDKLYVKDDKLKIDMDYFSIDTLSDTHSEKIFYRIVAPNGDLLAGFDGLSLADKKGYPTVFYHTIYAGTELRAVQYTSKTPLGDALIVVAESNQGRHTTISGLRKQIAFAAVLICIGTLILVAFIVQKGLHPLSRLQKEIRMRSEANLDPIETDVPPEVEALVRSLNNLMARLQRSIKISHNFNSDLSHQLRTPLAEMKMQLAMYRRDFQIEKLNDVDRNITLMTRLTEQMLHYVKAQNSTVSNKYWSCLDLVEFCRNFCEKYAPMVFSQGQAIAFETKIESAVCRIDEALLESALLNLIENALKYGKSHQGEGEIVLKLTSGNDSLSLSVTDQGSGVCNQDLESMLERKVRLDRSKQGFGLGLAIVKQVAEMHGGQLVITNASPRGLCITLSGLKINQAPSTKPLECRLVQAE